MKKELEQITINCDKQTIPYYSRHEFSMHQLIAHILEQTGPADVVLSTFSISEAPVRSFYNLSEKGLLKSLSCLFDFMVKKHKIGLLFFANNIVNQIAITKCHAKITLIKNENYSVSIISSANLNINDKIEAGIICKDESIYDFYYKLLMEDINNGLQITKDEFD